MKFKAIDLSRITRDELRFNPHPLSKWPTVEINVDDLIEQTCIASWRWDVRSADAWSNRMSEGAWDALNLNFYYLLSDIVCLSQGSPDIAQKVIEFSELYESLHCVIAYDVEDGLLAPFRMKQDKGDTPDKP